MKEDEIIEFTFRSASKKLAGSVCPKCGTRYLSLNGKTYDCGYSRYGDNETPCTHSSSNFASIKAAAAEASSGRIHR